MSVYHPPYNEHETVISTALRVIQATHYFRESDPHADAEQQYSEEQLALAARELAQAVDRKPKDEQPIGWNKDEAEQDLTRGRGQLLEAMSAVSEDRTACGWAYDWARTLHKEGGIWEILGRAVGWPTGNYEQWIWVSWDEAATLYAGGAE